jgi:hypothetical protein
MYIQEENKFTIFENDIEMRRRMGQPDLVQHLMSLK